MPIVVPLDSVLRAFIHEIPKAFRTHRPERHETIRRVSTAFLLYLLGRPEIRWQPPLPDALARTVARINAEPARPWDNPTMAREAHMSVGSFIRVFRRWMNTTPARYVTQVRIREAGRLLIGTERSIDEIAAQLGFPDRFYFTRVFKRATDLPPASYRRSHSPLARPGRTGE
jgi:AraC-like DNA-binding protein